MQGSHITIDLSALDRNFAAVQDEISAGGGPAVMAVVKSDAYGHGLERVVERAVAAGIPWFAVAYMHEALRVRAVDAAELGSAASANAPLPVHIKVDSGMGRLGAAPAELESIATQSGLQITGICSHFAAVEPKRIENAQAQVDVFTACAEHVESLLGRRLLRHISSSRAMQYFSEWDLDIVRPGIVLCLEWRTGIMQLKEVPEDTPIGYYSSYRTMQRTDIATIGAGYADGYLRSLSNRGYALVGGRRVPVVGRISMNWITLELGPDSGHAAGDEVVLLGRQADETIWAIDLSRWAGTIAYEILTAISPHLPKNYVEEGNQV